MSRYGLLVDYEYCSGCHSCEISCRNEKHLPDGQWGIKMTEVGPFKIDNKTWEWDYVPVPTQLCDLCHDRVAEGKTPACVLHCLGLALKYDTLEELMKVMNEKGSKVAVFLP